MGRTVTPLLRLRRFESCSPHNYKKTLKNICGFKKKFLHLQSQLPTIKNAEVAQLVERQPSKLNVAGSTPVFRSQKSQSTDCDFFISRYSSAVERFLGKEEVSGSSPDNGSIK